MIIAIWCARKPKFIVSNSDSVFLVKQTSNMIRKQVLSCYRSLPRNETMFCSEVDHLPYEGYWSLGDVVNLRASFVKDELTYYYSDVFSRWVLSGDSDAMISQSGDGSYPQEIAIFDYYVGGNVFGAADEHLCISTRMGK